MVFAKALVFVLRMSKSIVPVKEMHPGSSLPTQLKMASHTAEFPTQRLTNSSVNAATVSCSNNPV